MIALHAAAFVGILAAVLVAGMVVSAVLIDVARPLRPQRPPGRHRLR